MDTFVLVMVSKLNDIYTSIWRILLGAALAAFIYCLTIFFSPLNFLYGFIGGFFEILIATLISFGYCGIKRTLKLVLINLICTFLLGGTTTSIIYFINVEGFRINNSSVLIKTFFISTSFIYLALKFGRGFINTKVSKKSDFYTIHIYYKNKDAEVTALVDTGNFLSDPLTGKSAIIVEFFNIERLFNSNIKTAFYKSLENDGSKILNDINDIDFIKRARLLPFDSLGTKNGILLGFLADKIVIEREGYKNIIEKPLIALSVKRISDKGYNALISPQILSI